MKSMMLLLKFESTLSFSVSVYEKYVMDKTATIITKNNISKVLDRPDWKFMGSPLPNMRSPK
jgi:hypothetical protein